jgi:hypothetical protein
MADSAAYKKAISTWCTDMCLDDPDEQALDEEFSRVTRAFEEADLLNRSDYIETANHVVGELATRFGADA